MNVSSTPHLTDQDELDVHTAEQHGKQVTPCRNDPGDCGPDPAIGSGGPTAITSMLTWRRSKALGRLG